jgi:hypothetical protein
VQRDIRHDSQGVRKARGGRESTYDASNELDVDRDAPRYSAASAICSASRLPAPSSASERSGFLRRTSAPDRRRCPSVRQG